MGPRLAAASGNPDLRALLHRRRLRHRAVRAHPHARRRPAARLRHPAVRRHALVALANGAEAHRGGAARQQLARHRVRSRTRRLVRLRHHGRRPEHPLPERQGGAALAAPLAAVQRADVPALPAHLSTGVLPALRPGDRDPRRPARRDAGGPAPGHPPPPLPLSQRTDRAGTSTAHGAGQLLRPGHAGGRPGRRHAAGNRQQPVARQHGGAVRQRPRRDGGPARHLAEAVLLRGLGAHADDPQNTARRRRAAHWRQRVAGRRAAHPAEPGRHRDPVRPAGCQPRAPAAGRGGQRASRIQRVPRPGHAPRRLHDQARRLEVQLLCRTRAATIRPERRPVRVPRPCRRPTLRHHAGRAAP